MTFAHSHTYQQMLHRYKGHTITDRPPPPQIFISKITNVWAISLMLLISNMHRKQCDSVIKTNNGDKAIKRLKRSYFKQVISFEWVKVT